MRGSDYRARLTASVRRQGRGGKIQKTLRFTFESNSLENVHGGINASLSIPHSYAFASRVLWEA